MESENNHAEILWEGCAIIRLSEPVIKTMDPPDKKRSSVKFLFFITPKKYIAIHDHRDKSKLSSLTRIGDNILRMDLNRRAAVSVKRRLDGTEYIVLEDALNNVPAIYALQEISASGASATTWSSCPNRDDVILAIKKFKIDD